MKDESDKRFFITHSHADNAFAERLFDDLKGLELDGFFDIYSIRPGDNIPAQINKGLAECDVYIPILSNAALGSPWCEEEITTAIMLSKRLDRYGRPRIIPVLIEDCQSRIVQQYPSLLTRLYVSFVGRYEDALRELLVKGLGLPLDDKIPSHIAKPIHFVQIPLIESGLANEDLRIYKKPPFGDCEWFGIPFRLQNARISMADTFDGQGKLLNLSKPLAGARAVHILINSGDGRKKHLNREIGSINFMFEHDKLPQHGCSIILGENIREWAIGNYVTISETDGRPEPLVDSVESKKSREIWRGETSHGQVAVIDMLTVDIDVANYSKRLTGVEFIRSIPRNGIALDYFILGITIEASALK